MTGHDTAPPRPAGPLWLLAELTYRCPLHCVFCYNPVDYKRNTDELTTEQWKETMKQARALGAVQLGFSGGEPLLRDDLEELVAYGHELGYYTNLITSGIGLKPARLDALKAAGLDHIQVSFQDATQAANDALSDTKTFQKKLEIATAVKAAGWPMVLNVVLHRLNLDHIDSIIELAVKLGVEYLELANTQYYGWAFQNKAALIPTHEQLKHAEERVAAWREELGNTMKLLFVVPDYFEKTPKPCMSGWGNVFLSISPDGTALPCQAARMLPGFEFPNVKTRSVEHIWFESDGFTRYRGDAWMKDPCRTCPDKAKDYGGCRCQAYLITGDATHADPVCKKSPDHEKVVAFVDAAQRRDNPDDYIKIQKPEQQGLATVAEVPVVWYRSDHNSLHLSNNGT
ncbi:MAG: pyrroloquinoline quinone biosynthesis protein PqqE [Limnobacter sp.]|uniref:pyrroloquinoline quinone biosynthesis protein PqqE n=1 Tax=Limnobacter sp. TaxID=2003368 RepID=UPI0022BD2A78|nr:pyrroloquinoline quinone biosynthesis protein PqqE [Limnobacter sp.]MCZ8014177.1 pyrroloquinoline quinone biosynthesis protein PqqE [Limnobacter sp.]